MAASMMSLPAMATNVGDDIIEVEGSIDASCNIPKITQINHALKFCFVVELEIPNPNPSFRNLPCSARSPEPPKTRHPYPEPCFPLNP